MGAGRPGEREDIPMPLRTLHFGRHDDGLVTFLVYPPDDLVLVVRIQWLRGGTGLSGGPPSASRKRPRPPAPRTPTPSRRVSPAGHWLTASCSASKRAPRMA